MSAKKWMLLVLGLGLLVALVGCGADASASDVKQATATSPEEVVRAFYTWYLDYIGDLRSGEFRNPLVDGAYRSSEYLSQSFVQKVDAILASFNGAGYDPILCAQDIPESFSLTELKVEGDTASLVVETSFVNHFFSVELQRLDGAWKIDDVVCSQSEPPAVGPEGPMPTSPEQTVRGFYSWYLWYAREQGNPLVDQVYHGSEYLTDGLVQKVDGILASFDRGGFDPFLCAQDIPESYSLGEPVVTGDVARVIVRTSFAGHAFTVALQQVNGRWLMSDVLCEVEQPGPGDDADEPGVEPPAGSPEGWQTFADAEYGFALHYPADWAFTELETEGPGVPEDWPVERIVQFFPAAWAEALSGPPDPTQPVVVAPLTLEVCVGDMEQFRRVYPEPTQREALERNGLQVIFEREGITDEISLDRYVFQSPSQPQVWIVLIDYISGFPDRATGNEAIIDLAQQIALGLQFTQ